MNNFFRKKRLVVFFAVCVFSGIAILIGYFKLAMQPVVPAPKNQPVIERGSIVDRSGFPLAVQTNFYRIGLSCRDLKNKEQFSKDMAYVLDMTEEELFSKIEKRKDHITLIKKATQAEYEDIKFAALDYEYSNIMTYEKLPGRLYPNNSLAAQLIGYMGDEGQGLAGIEFSQQDILCPAVDKNLETPEQGNNIFLSIDANMQYKLEQIAYKTLLETQGESVMLLAADCKTGEILSYISLPSVDLNEYGTGSPSGKINRPTNDAYEPGSVFKIFTMGIVYDQGGIKAGDKFICDGGYERKLSNGETIRISCLDHHGKITPEQALQLSCNDVFGQISDKIGEEAFMTKIRQLGFGQKTGIELSGETTGLVKDIDSKTWSARSKPTIAIGQEISVSALQMVQAATAIANGGIPVKLTVIDKITNKEGAVIYEHKPEYKERVFKKSTADYVLSCMETTATVGTGSKANLSDISIGVKTGTAQMADKVHGGYSETDFIANCIAIFPIEAPRIVLYVVIQKAQGEYLAGRIAAPVIAEAADVIIDHMGMSRGDADSFTHTGVVTIPSAKQIKLGSELPDFTGYSKKELLPLTEMEGIKVTVSGSGWVTSQNPEPGTPITENMSIELFLE